MKNLLQKIELTLLQVCGIKILYFYNLNKSLNILQSLKVDVILYVKSLFTNIQITTLSLCFQQNNQFIDLIENHKSKFQLMWVLQNDVDKCWNIVKKHV